MHYYYHILKQRKEIQFSLIDDKKLYSKNFEIIVLTQNFSRY